VTDPENSVGPTHDELYEQEVDLADEFDRPLPTEANEADVVDQKWDVPELLDDDEDVR
jgi:hypothetical protein